MKKFFLMLAIVASATVTNAQNIAPLLQPSAGNLFNGMTRQITYDRMIPPYGIEVSFDKTVHVIFPSAIRYVDLGSADIIAGKADGAENVIRIKAAVQGFERETNFSVITDEGSFFSFNVKYADEPRKLNIEMKDFINDGEAVNRPNNSLDIFLAELGNESPRVVNLIMRSIHESNKRRIRHIGSKRFGIQYLLKGIYTYNDHLYFHIQTKNSSQVPFDMDYFRIKIVDKQVAKRTAIQETVIYPVRAYRHDIRIPGRSANRTVFALPKFTIPNDKQLIVELFEKNGGRHQSFVIENDDLIRARTINDLRVR
jgi:conjugative transposon TraN protein